MTRREPRGGAYAAASRRRRHLSLSFPCSHCHPAPSPIPPSGQQPSRSPSTLWPLPAAHLWPRQYLIGGFFGNRGDDRPLCDARSDDDGNRAALLSDLREYLPERMRPHPAPEIGDEGLRGASKMMDDNLSVFGKIVETVCPLLHHAAALGEVPKLPRRCNPLHDSTTMTAPADAE
jgi:hypothetical protein